MLFERLKSKFEEMFPERKFEVKSTPNKTITIKPDYYEFGEVEIIDDGNELTLIAGNFTHGHFSCYENISDEEKENQIVESAIDFLEAMFNDKVIFWGTHKGMGGWHRIDFDANFKEESGKEQYFWSGPVRKSNS